MITVLRALLGRSRSDVLLAGVLFASALALLALASTIRGVGYYDGPGCIGGSGMDPVRLSPFIYLPYWLTGFDCVNLGGLVGWTLADQFNATPTLYAWTIAWWIAVSFLLGRLLSAGISRLWNRSRNSDADDSPPA